MNCNKDSYQQGQSAQYELWCSISLTFASYSYDSAYNNYLESIYFT